MTIRAKKMAYNKLLFCINLNIIVIIIFIVCLLLPSVVADVDTDQSIAEEILQNTINTKPFPKGKGAIQQGNVIIIIEEPKVPEVEKKS